MPTPRYEHQRVGRDQSKLGSDPGFVGRVVARAFVFVAEPGRRSRFMEEHVDLRARLIEILEPRLLNLGIELVDVRVAAPTSGARSRSVCLLIDTVPGTEEADTGVSIEDCVRVSREIGAFLDEADVIPFAYTLEVSSPGVDRPLRTAEHFERFAGEPVEIKMSREFGARAKFTGTLLGVSDGTVRVRSGDGEHELPLHQVFQARAKLDPWKPRGAKR